jgi:hypothetical protein
MALPIVPVMVPVIAPLVFQWIYFIVPAIRAKGGCVLARNVADKQRTVVRPHHVQRPVGRRSVSFTTVRAARGPVEPARHSAGR